MTVNEQEQEGTQEPEAAAPPPDLAPAAPPLDDAPVAEAAAANETEPIAESVPVAGEEAPGAPAATATSAPAADRPPGDRPPSDRPPRRDGGGGGGGDDERPRRRHFGRRRVCAFCADKVTSIDYKDAMRLRRFLSDRARVEPRRKTGTCAKHQRWLAVALKRARHLAMLPYTPEHIRLSGVSTGRGR